MLGDDPARSFRGREWLLLAAVAVAVFAAYQPAWNGGLLWDDAAHVTRADLRSWQGLWRIWFEPGATQQYYPLLHSAFWVEHRLWGDAPLGYHLVNLALHSAAAILVALALRRLAVPGALLIAAAFALHPVHVESVAWITEQKNTLSAVLYLGAALLWLRWDERRERRAYALALALFLLALCAKTVTATLPAALLVVAWWRRRRVAWRQDVVPLLPFFAAAIAAGASTIWVEKNLVGAQGAGFELHPPERLLLAGRAAWFYLGKLLWPSDLAFVYPRWSFSANAFWQYLYPAAAVAALAALWALRKRLPGAFAGALFFLGTLVPALGFFDVYPFLFSFVADHFQYLASLGILAIAGSGAALCLRRGPLALRRAGQAACAVGLATLALLTWKHSHIYADRETLYRATLGANPDCWMAWNNLAGALLARGDAAAALPLAERALALRPRYPEAHNNVALALAALGRTGEALPHYRAAIELDPGYAEAHNNFGFALAATGETDAALAQYRLALRGDAANPGIHYNYAMALIERGDSQPAIAHLLRAIELRPDFVQAHNNLGILLARSGRLQEAIQELREALELAPDSAEVRRNLDIALARSAAVR